LLWNSEKNAVIHSEDNQPDEPKISGREQQSDPEYVHGKSDFFPEKLLT
jgi:hypothetical protein